MWYIYVMHERTNYNVYWHITIYTLFELIGIMYLDNVQYTNIYYIDGVVPVLLLYIIIYYIGW